MDSNPPSAQDLRFELHVTLTPQPDGLRPIWRAELRSTPSGDSLRFESMAELVRYLTRLDTTTLARGIR